MADDHDVRPSFQRLLGAEAPSQLRADPKRRKEVDTHNDAGNALRLVSAGDREVPREPPKRRELLERGAEVPVVPVVVSGSDRVDSAVERGTAQHQPARLRVRERANHGRVDDAEHRHVGPDPDPEDEDNDKREARRLCQRPARKADILPEAAHHQVSQRDSGGLKHQLTLRARCLRWFQTLQHAWIASKARMLTE